MKKLFKQIFAIIMAIAMIFTIAPFNGFLIESGAETISGDYTYGELAWTFDTEKGLLEISGKDVIPEGEIEGVTNWPYDVEKNEVRSIKIADDVTGVGAYAFADCNNLTSVTIGDGVKKIGECAFLNCVSLEDVELGKSVKSIEYDAFKGCKSLTEIDLPESVTSVYIDAFNGCTALEKISVDKDNKAYSSDSTGVLFNKNKTILIKYPIGNTKEKYTIPDTVKEISENAFSDCVNLAEVTIPGSVKRIGDFAFKNTKLYNDPENWTDGVLYLGNYLLASKTELSGEYAIKDGTKVIADSALSGYNNLTSVIIPASVIRIGKYAFFGCENLESVKIDNATTSIGEMAFYDCKKLTEIILPDTVTDIEGSAFFNTAYYNNAENWTEDVLYIGNFLINAKDTLAGAYTIKDNTKAIAEYAFSNCKELTTAILGDSVVRIGAGAFYNSTNLTSVTLSGALKEVGYGAFNSCSYLVDVFYPGDEDDWNGISFEEENEEIIFAIIHYGFTDDSFTEKTTVLVSVVNTVNGPKLTWKEVENANGYYVYRKTTDTTWVELGTAAGTSFTDKNAESGTDYIYTAKAYNDKGTTEIQSGLSIKCLDAPTVTSIRNTTRGVEISWEAVNGATEYNVYRKTKASDPYSKIGTTSSTTFEWQRETSGTTYYYVVRASAGEGSLSSYRAGSKIKYLASPTVSSISNSVAGVKVVWNKIAGASDYHIYRKTINGSYAKIGDSTSTSFTDKKAISGITYYYTVRARNADTLSSYRAGAKVTFLKAPVGTTVVNTTAGVKVTWDRIFDASGYYVYRKTSANGSYTKIGETTSSSFVDKTAKSGTSYYYTVRAYSDASISSYNAGKGIKYLTSPTISSVVNTTAGAKAVWGKITGASGYYVYRKTANGSYARIGTTTSTSFVDKTAKKGTTYYYTVRAYSGKTLSSYRAGTRLTRR